jgi:two-component system, OmpR family, aerobic respiration control sensor histidine kinase ArcB
MFLHQNWVLLASLFIVVFLGYLIYFFRSKWLLQSRELNFRTGILESANKMLEELIAERRLIEAELKESETAFKSLFLQSSDPILLIQNNTFFDCNPSALRFLGYTDKEQVIGKRPEDLSPEYQNKDDKSAELAPKAIAQCFAKGHNRFEWIHLRADGSEITVEVVLTAIKFKGERTIHVSWRDITGRNRALQALKENEERYRLLVDNQTDLVVKVDNEGRFMYVSPSYCKLFGTSAEKLLGNSFMPLVHPDDLESTKREMEKLYKPPHNCSLEQRALTVSGWRWLSWVDTAILDQNGAVAEIIGVGRDITDNMQARIELINQKTFIQTVLDNLPVGIAMNEFNSGKISYMNKNFAVICGWPPDDIHDMDDLYQRVFPDSRYRDLMVSRISADIATGDPGRMNWDNIAIVTQSGKQRFVSMANIPIFEQNIMVSTVQDITDHKQNEINIERERDKLQMLFSIAARIGQSDSFEDVLQYTLERICLEAGWDVGEAWLPSEQLDKMVYSGAYYMTDENLTDFVTASRDYTFSPGEGLPGRVWQQKEPVWINDLQQESNFLRLELAKTYHLTTGVGIPIIAQDTVVSVLVFFMKQPHEIDQAIVQLVKGVGLQIGELFRRKNIQDQKDKTLEMLRQSDFQLKQAQRIASIGSWEFNYNTNMAIGSEEARRIYGLSKMEMPIQELSKLIVEQYRPVVRDAFNQHVNSGKPYDVIFQIERANDKQLRFVHSLAEFHKAENKLIGIIRDITEEMINEGLKQEIMVAKESAKFKHDFLARMSHEIRTPLTAIEGMIELVGNTPLDNIQKDYFETMRFSSANLKNIINEVLDYSKIEAEGITLHPVDFAVEELYERSVRLFESICKNDCVLLTKGKDQLPPYLHADKQRIFQIITNFISNAVKYANTGTVTLEIIMPEQDEVGEKLFKVMLHDQGPGISDKMKRELFKPFSQIHIVKDIPIEGTGLGLSICKELAEILGGEIDVESQPGVGSTFWFSFRARIVDELIAPNNTSSDQRDQISSTGLRIFMAEDKDVNQKVISLILNSLGHKVTMVSNGREALELFQPAEYDLLLMDIQMPVMDGITATRLLKQKYPDMLPPIVGLSANAMLGDREKYMKQGMDDYITKPVRSKDFNELIVRLGL